MEIVVYRISGSQGLFRVPDWICPECDLTIAAVEAAVKQSGLPYVVVTVRPWLQQLPRALKDRAMHPPVVLVDGRIQSQGVVPDPAVLAEYLRAHSTGSGADALEHPRP